MHVESTVSDRDYRRCLGCGCLRKTNWFLAKRPTPGGGYIFGCRKCGSMKSTEPRAVSLRERLFLLLGII